MQRMSPLRRGQSPLPRDLSPYAEDVAAPERAEPSPSRLDYVCTRVLCRRGCDLHIGRVEATSGRAVHLCSVVEGALAGLHIAGIAAPRLERGRLQRAAVRERELPR